MDNLEKQFSLDLEPEEVESAEETSLEELKDKYKELVGVSFYGLAMTEEEGREAMTKAIENPNAEKARLLAQTRAEDASDTKDTYRRW